MGTTTRLVAMLFAFAASLDAGATAQRTFVASTGSDSNACSPLAPCRSFATAIAHTSPGGEVIVLDSAGYGSVTITQSVSIIAPAGVYAGLSVFSGDGVNVNGAGITVILRGLTINGQGGNRGIVFLAGSHLHVENCVISGLAQNGVYAASVGSNLHVSDTVVRETAGDGVLLQGGMLVTFERVQIKHSTGVALQIMEGAIASIRDSAFANNDAGGIEVDANIGDFSKALIQGSQIVFNGGHGVSAIATLGKHALVTIESSNVSNNANSGVFAQTSSGGTIWLAARDNMLDNNVVGYNLVTSLPVDSLIATLADNLIHDQTGSGIRTVNYGSITVTVSGNTITRNANFGISVDAGVSAQTPQNNVVVNNLYGDIGGTGTLTTIPLH